jgi:hypothetical protein
MAVQVDSTQDVALAGLCLARTRQDLSEGSGHRCSALTSICQKRLAPHACIDFRESPPGLRLFGPSARVNRHVRPNYISAAFCSLILALPRGKRLEGCTAQVVRITRDLGSGIVSNRRVGGR